MSRTRRTTLIAAALITGSVLTGCGAGQVASTAEQVSNTTGGNAEVGAIAVRTAVIEFGEEVEGGAVYPRGADAPLAMTIVNEGGEADRLVSASTPVARSVEISGDVEVPAGRAVVVGGGEATEQGAGAPGGAPVPTPQPRPGGEATASIVLTGLTEDVRAGVSYPVTLTFERAGDLTLAVPVDSSAEAREVAEGGE